MILFHPAVSGVRQRGSQIRDLLRGLRPASQKPSSTLDGAEDPLYAAIITEIYHACDSGMPGNLAVDRVVARLSHDVGMILGERATSRADLERRIDGLVEKIEVIGRRVWTRRQVEAAQKGRSLSDG